MSAGRYERPDAQRERTKGMISGEKEDRLPKRDGQPFGEMVRRRNRDSSL